VRYGDRRRQFGPEPGVLLLDYPSHQRRLLPLLADTYALHFALRHLVATDVAVTADPDAGERRTRALEGLAAGLKAASTWHATATIQECREACGGQGYLSENRFGDLKADTEVFTTFEGDNTVLLQLVAKGLLTDYRQQFEDMDLMKALRLFASRAGDLLGDANLLAGRSTDTDHLRDRDFHLDAFREREDHMTAALGRRLKARMDDGMDPALAFLSVQPHVLATARAHVERVVLEQLAAAVDACSDPALVAVLGAVCDLHALARLEADRGWFLEHGQFAPAKAKAITREVTALCAELRPHAVDLVDAFGIPDELLAAPPPDLRRLRRLRRLRPRPCARLRRPTTPPPRRHLSPPPRGHGSGRRQSAAGITRAEPSRWRVTVPPVPPPTTRPSLAEIRSRKRSPAGTT
jgi:acyl-CoA oxidase